MRHLLKHAVLAIICVALPTLLLAQVSVTGTVTDANNNPLPGVSVRVKNSNIGTSTDPSGRFTITAPSKGATLEISSIGFKTQSIQVSDNTAPLSIKMEEDAGRLDEVVVTGLATSVKRRNLANAIATVSSKDLVGTAPAQTFDAALNGKVPGALINANSGAPGGGISVKLRGVTSIFGNTQPLFVVDGVFIDNTATPAGLNSVTAAARGGNSSNQDNPSGRVADLRSEDIENIEILKGASAAAIYGSKAAAGVVIITTKRGKSGKTKLTLSQDIGFVKVRNLLGQRSWTEERAAELGPVALADFQEAKAAGRMYDYEEEMFGETGLTRNTGLSLVGGNERTSFFLSGGLKDEEGIVKKTGYEYKSLRVNVDHRITDNIKVGVSSTYINSGADRGLTNNDNNSVSYGVALSATPNFTELHRNALGYPDNKYTASNPLQTRDLANNSEKVSRFITGVTLDAILQKSDVSTTRFIGRGGFDNYTLKTSAYFPNELQFMQTAEGTSVQGYAKSLNYNVILSLVNNFSPSDRFNLTSSAGITQENGDFDNILNVASKMIAGQPNVDQAGALSPTQLRNKFQDNGIFLQEEATLIDAITLTGGVRLDRSSNNGDASKFYFYPKAGLSVNLTRMDFWKSSLFDNLKLRVAYGQAGNFPAFGSRFELMSIFNIGGNVGLYPAIARGSKDIEPERTSELEAGFDVSMLGGKVNLEFTVYEKRITDFLLQRAPAGSSGFSQEFVNAGNLRNRGMEVSLNTTPVSNRSVRWNSIVNFWFNRSKVTRLNVDPVVLGVFGTSLGSFKIEEGRPATQIVGAAGSPDNVIPIGDAEPNFQMNFLNEVTFLKNFAFRFLLHWKNGGDNINLSQLLTDLSLTSPDYDDDGGTKGPNRVGRFGDTYADVYTQSASYLRLREVGLFYNFSKMPTSVIKGLRIGVSANNFLTITNYDGYDPEVSNFGTGFSTNVDVMPFPASKRATFHLTIDF
jgi:TonB-linked SusC/RagA family outer membrane protein